MTATEEMPPVCPRTGLARTGTGCLHCVYSVKLADWWTCVFKGER